MQLRIEFWDSVKGIYAFDFENKDSNEQLEMMAKLISGGRTLENKEYSFKYGAMKRSLYGQGVYECFTSISQLDALLNRLDNILEITLHMKYERIDMDMTFAMLKSSTGYGLFVRCPNASNISKDFIEDIKLLTKCK